MFENKRDKDFIIIVFVKIYKLKLNYIYNWSNEYWIEIKDFDLLIYEFNKIMDLIRFYYIDNYIIIKYCIYLLYESIVFLVVDGRGCEEVIIV